MNAKDLLKGFLLKPEKPDGILKNLLSLYMFVICIGLLISGIDYKIAIGGIGIFFFGMHLFWSSYFLALRIARKK